MKRFACDGTGFILGLHAGGEPGTACAPRHLKMVMGLPHSGRVANTEGGSRVLRAVSPAVCPSIRHATDATLSVGSCRFPWYGLAGVWRDGPCPDGDPDGDVQRGVLLACGDGNHRPPARVAHLEPSTGGEFGVGGGVELRHRHKRDEPEDLGVVECANAEGRLAGCFAGCAAWSFERRHYKAS